jgi:hypothetical protein
MSFSASTSTKTRHPAFLIKIRESGNIERIFELDEKGGLISDIKSQSGIRTQLDLVGKKTQKVKSISSTEKETSANLNLPKSKPNISNQELILDSIFAKVEEEYFLNLDLLVTDSFTPLFFKN